ncbi:MAG: CpaF family protein [Lachnospiraceae bacterium]|jgi:pilus assembly protein CpaF|nr:CpaF family protein [Lachnospiraceae bacterium]
MTYIAKETTLDSNNNPVLDMSDNANVDNVSRIRETIRQRILTVIDQSDDLSDGEIKDLIDSEIIKLAKSREMGYETRKRLRREIYHTIRKLDILQDLLDTPEITEIMINGTDSIFIEKSGKLERSEYCFTSKEKLGNVIQQIVSECNRTVNEASPIADARLRNGARVNVVLAPVALNGPIVTIRRFPDEPVKMDDLLEYGALSLEMADFLEKAVKKGESIIVSGGTGSGKTTFLNVLSNYIPSRERIITIEDSAELQILGIPNIVKLETRGSNVEGCREITIRDLIKSALRMRPDRIVVGEVRGAEAIDLLQAMNTGHPGSMSTLHANHAKDMVSRLETMVLMGTPLPLTAIRKQIASGVQLVVQLGRLEDSSRKVLEIAAVAGIADDEIVMKPLYKLREEGEDESGRIKVSWEVTV